MFDRTKAIECLIADDIEYVNNQYGMEFINNILSNGFIGYSNQTDEQLMQELSDRDISYLFGNDDDTEA